MFTLRINMTTNQKYNSHTLIDYGMKLKLKISINILAETRKYLISVIIQLSQNTLIIQIN